MKKLTLKNHLQIILNSFVINVVAVFITLNILHNII